MGHEELALPGLKHATPRGGICEKGGCARHGIVRLNDHLFCGRDFDEKLSAIAETAKRLRQNLTVGVSPARELPERG